MRYRILDESLGSLVLHTLIRGCLVAGTLASALGVAQSAASADDDDDWKEAARLLPNDLDAWKNVDGQLQVDPHAADHTKCDEHLAALTKANAPASLTFKLRHDTPELKAGEHSWPEARAACATLKAFAAHKRALDSINWVIFNCQDEMKAGFAENLPHFENAKRSYKEAIAAGVLPTDVIHGNDVTGTVKELFEKWCLAGEAKLRGAEDARSAPFKKRLKNDKLRIALEDSDYIMLPGGAAATPDHLAAANVWFEDASPNKTCPNGAQVHVLHRYQFDAQQKLAKVTDREFCGRPPAGAFH